MRVLVVKDSVDSANAFGKLIRAAGHTTEQVSAVSQAIALVATFDFKVAFIDLDLADGDAEALAVVLSEKGVKCVALTNRNVATTPNTAFASSLSKPVDLRELLAILAILRKLS